MRLSVRYGLLAAFICVIIINVTIVFYSSNILTPDLTSTTLNAHTHETAWSDKLQDRWYRNSTALRAQLDLMPLQLRAVANRLPVTITAEEFRSQPKAKTGNPLIDAYGANDLFWSGEQGRGVTFVDKDKEIALALQREFNINVMASDVIPLHRTVPDSRLEGCEELTYEHDLPSASVIVPFYDEWPSILLRTVYSIVNRTPRHLLQEIILIDDSSTMVELKEPLQQYIEDHFPRGLVRLLRSPSRDGLIRARMRGWAESKGDVVVFFDSHMEVNIDWLQPLLTVIKTDRRTVAMSVLDYINFETLEYRFNRGYLTRYGFDWRLVFFETFFREDQIGPRPTSPRPGTVMVGAAFAMDRKYFEELGGYDMGMKVWGGENLEMSWRVWLCGGRLVHLPCSHLGHIARWQPYDFPDGRQAIEMYNYKRAVEVWMGPYTQFVHDYFPEMVALDVGDLSDRIALRDRLGCRNFSWYLENIWPELNVYNHDVIGWGSLVNNASGKCLDNHSYLFQAPADLYSDPCHYHFSTQGFSLTKGGLLRTTLQCVIVKDMFIGGRPKIEDCLIGQRDLWNHTQDGLMIHVRSKLCLDVDPNGPIMRMCESDRISQRWFFTKYNSVTK